MRDDTGRIAGIALLWAVSIGISAAEEPAPAAVVLDAFGNEPGDRWRGSGLTVSERTLPDGTTPSGGGAIELSREGAGGHVEATVEPRDWRGHDALAFHVLAEGSGEFELRVLAYGGAAPRAMVRRFRVEPGAWREVVLPLKDFRPDNVDPIGTFERIERVRVRWDKGDGKVLLDDLRLLPGTRGADSCRPTTEDRLKLAFPSGKGKALESEHFLLLTDEPSLHGAEGKKLLARLEEGLRTLAKRFGIEAPLPDRAPLVVFRAREDYVAFPPRLGEHYGATVPQPKADGFTVLGVASSSFDPAQGWDRPVFVHEAMHAALERNLGIASSGNWLQEGLATAVQATLHPKSLGTWNLGGEIRAMKEGTKSRFQTWSKLLSNARPSIPQYAELATIVTFLAVRYESARPAVWNAVRALDGSVHEKALPAIARALEKTPEALETEWLEWGPKHYGK